MSEDAINRPTRRSERAALKLATRSAIEAAGGAAALVREKMVRIGETALSFCISPKPEHDDRFVGFDTALDLDRLAGEPVHARALAEAQGWKLVPMASGYLGDVCLVAIAGFFAACAPAKLALMAAMADGRIDPVEAADCDAKLAELEREVGAMRARLRKRMKDGEQ